MIGDGPPPTLERLLSLARRQLRIGQLDGAVETLRRALAEDPDHADAHALLALVLHDMKRLHAAAYESDRALTLDPLGFLPLLASGIVLLARRKLSEAEDRFQQLRQLAPESAEPLRRLAAVRGFQGERREVRELLDEALRREPENVDVLTDLGDWHLEAGDAAGAERHARGALEIEPESPEALVLMGHVLLRRGRSQEAREHAVWALRKNPESREALYLMAAIKARKNPLLGLWWRWSIWMGALGEGRAILVLLAAFVVYRFGTITAAHLGYEDLAAGVQIAWLALVAYTWFGPTLFYRSLRKDLAGVELRDF